MNIKELRIGNYFYEENSKQIIKVIELKENSMTFSGKFSVKWQAKPIKLTKKLLLNLGFSFAENKSNLMGKRVLGIWIKDNMFSLYDNSETIINDVFGFGLTIKEVEIKYVHQLQNLYFDMIGEELELTIKSI